MTDATLTDAEFHEVIFENDRVRVVHMTYQPGRPSPAHTHLPGVNIGLTTAQVKSAPEGTEAEEATAEAGGVSWADAGPAHVTENNGETDFTVIRVEIKAAA